MSLLRHDTACFAVRWRARDFAYFTRDHAVRNCPLGCIIYRMYEARKGETDRLSEGILNAAVPSCGEINGRLFPGLDLFSYTMACRK